MSFNKSLFFVKKRYSRLSQLQVAYKFARSYSSISTGKCSKLCIQILRREVHLKSRRILPSQKISYSFSSAVSEETVKLKHPDTVITVPSLEFEDVKFEQPVSYEELCDTLQTCNSVAEQMLSLASTLALSLEDVEKRKNFCKVLEQLLRAFFGDIKIQMFGSSANGFGFKGCDIDMSYKTFTGQRTFTEQNEQSSCIKTLDVPLVSEVIYGRVSPHEISSLPEREQLIFIHSVLCEFYKETEEKINFVDVQIPFVRFNHDKYNLKCDLSCSNLVAFSNTKMLRLFGQLDERVIPILMTIRYWAKCVELTGRSPLFNTYTISLLVIHFLQTRKPPVLPTVEHILSLSSSLEIEDMEDKTFLDIKNSIPPSKNTQTLDELLKEFFFYYLYFDFTRVICPLIGGSIPRNEFLSNERNRKFRIHNVCIRDPMLVSHNVAEFIEFKTYEKLRKELIAACRIFQDRSDFSPKSSKWGLLTLFDKPEKCKQKNISFNIPIITNPVISKSLKKDANLMTAETLLHLLKHILLFECRPLDISEVIDMLKRHDELVERQRITLQAVYKRQSEIRKFTGSYIKNSEQFIPKKKDFYNTPVVEDFQKFNSEHTLVLCAECRVTKNSWIGRNCVAVESLPVNSVKDYIEKERHISLQTAKQNELNCTKGKPEPLVFFCECYVSSQQSLLINFRLFQLPEVDERKIKNIFNVELEFNPILEIFSKEYLPKLFEHINQSSYSFRSCK